VSCTDKKIMMRILFIILVLSNLHAYSQGIFEKAFSDSLSSAEWSHNTGKKNTLLSSLSGKKQIPNVTLCYFEQLLHDCPNNSILFTNGDLDTYTLWMIQSTKSFRKDVTVVRLKDALKGNYKTQSPIKKLEAANLESLIKNIQKSSNYKAIHFSVTINTSALKSINQKLYLTGTSYHYTEQDYDNIKVLEHNLSTICLNEEDIPDDSPLARQAKKVETNYIPGLVLLYRKYKNANDNSTASQYKEKALRIAERHGLKGKLEKQLAK
jgi:hypothetical protein